MKTTLRDMKRPMNPRTTMGEYITSDPRIMMEEVSGVPRLISNCCSAAILHPDVCMACKEHCEGEEAECSRCGTTRPHPDNFTCPYEA